MSKISGFVELGVDYLLNHDIAKNAAFWIVFGKVLSDFSIAQSSQPIFDFDFS